MKEEKEAPTLRFKGFTDDWEQCKLGDVCDITAGGDINKGDLINKGKYPVIANGLNNNGIVGYSNKYKIDAPAVTITGRGTLGVATARFINFTPIVRLISIKSDLDPIYLENIINNTHFVIESTGVPQLTAPQVKRQTVLLSNCHIEQTKIGSLLSTLDHTITLHEEKKRQLEHLKSALLQKMFADKSGYPAVLFRGFDERWEQYKAKELFESKSKKDHGDLPVLSATQENGIVFRNDLDIDIKFDTHALSNYKVVSPGDYIISLRSFQGGFELSEKRGIISPAYTVFAFNNQEKNRQNSTFWKYLFKRYDFIESLKRLTFGIRDGKAISFNQFSTLKLSFPNFDEQNKIATLLHVLDKNITLHNQKLNLLKLVKQSLLQNMFI
jgi:type I restriction enzyme S subunit